MKNDSCLEKNLTQLQNSRQNKLPSQNDNTVNKVNIGYAQMSNKSIQAINQQLFSTGQQLAGKQLRTALVAKRMPINCSILPKNQQARLGSASIMKGQETSFLKGNSFDVFNVKA